MKTFAALFALAACALAQEEPAPYGTSTGMGTTAKPSRSWSRPYRTGTVTTTVTTTIYCPLTTTFMCQGTTYSVSTPTYVTMTCPGKCVTSAVPTTTSCTTTATSKAAVYTGAAMAVKPEQAGALAAAALGLLVL